MTDLTLTINGHDYSDIVEERQYTTYYTPVEGKRYTNLNLVDRVNIVRYRGGLIFKLNPLSTQRAAELYTDLIQQPIQVSYFSFQRNAIVVENMQTVGINMQDGFSFLSKRWGTASSLEFVEL